MIEVTKSEFIQWIFAIPDDELLDFHHGEISYACACPMVQYGLARGFEFTACSSDSWVDRKTAKTVAILPDSVFRMLNVYKIIENKTRMTFGELKEYLKSNNILP